MDKELLSTTELARLLGISRVAVFKRIKAGKIKARKIGRQFFISRRDLPFISGETLSGKQKKEIEGAVKKTVREYGETLKLLGAE